MTKIASGTRVEKGYYFNLNTWSLLPVAADGAALPGGAGERYLRVPLLLAFAVAPLMGAAFLMFLPFVGFYLALSAALRPVLRTFRSSAEEVAATMQPGWAPGEAHLTGRWPEGGREPAKAPAGAGARLEALAGEIAARRAAQRRS